MSGIKLLLDTNIIIYFLRGDLIAKNIISATSQYLKIPIVTADKDLFAIQELEIIN